MGNSDRVILGELELELIKQIRHFKPEYNKLSDRELAKIELRNRLFDLLRSANIPADDIRKNAVLRNLLILSSTNQPTINGIAKHGYGLNPTYPEIPYFPHFKA